MTHPSFAIHTKRGIHNKSKGKTIFALGHRALWQSVVDIKIKNRLCCHNYGERTGGLLHCDSFLEWKIEKELSKESLLRFLMGVDESLIEKKDLSNEWRARLTLLGMKPRDPISNGTR